MSDDDKLITKDGRKVDRDLWDVALSLVGGDRQRVLPTLYALQDERERWKAHIDSFEMEDRIIEQRGANVERERCVTLVQREFDTPPDQLGDWRIVVKQIRSGQEP